MNRFLTYISVFLFGAALTVLPGMAQQTSDKDPNGTAMSSKQSAGTKAMESEKTSDKTFVKKAAEGGLAEVELGKLATEKASSEDVKKFGQRMVDDHSKANDELKKVAEQEHISLPTELSAKDKTTKERLEKLSGEQFDHAYMREMVKDHKKDVAEFARESKVAKDPAVKNFAQQTLPTLREHLKEAEKIAPTQTASARSPHSKHEHTSAQ